MASASVSSVRSRARNTWLISFVSSPARSPTLSQSSAASDGYFFSSQEVSSYAFNEPFSSLNSRTRLKTLTQDTIQVNARFFGGDISLVPKTALTVGVGTVLSAKKVLILATGHKKARAVRHGVEGSYNHQWTISALQVHPNGILVCDDPAAEELRVATYRYFKDIERENLISK